MADVKHPEALRLADWCDEHSSGIYRPSAQATAELRRQHAENETLRRKLQTLEELGDASDDVQLLRMGYDAARLEIASLHAQLDAVGAGGVGRSLMRPPHAWQVNHIADHVADNWPMRKYDLAEIEQRLRDIPAAPKPPAQAQEDARKPLADEQISSVYFEVLGTVRIQDPTLINRLVRAIEAAHGIAAKQGGANG